MLFYSDSQGVIQAAIPSPVNQGSIGVNEVILIAPFPSQTVVSATFTLPNGVKLYPQYVGKDELEASDYPYIMAVVEAFTGKLPVIDGVSLNVWRLTLDKAITQVAGNVTIQFLFTGVNGTLTSTAATLPVNRGNAYLAPSVTTSDLDTIAGFLTRAKIAAENAETDAGTAISAQRAAEAAQGKAEEAEAKAAEHAKLYEEILPRLEYDHVITTEEELANLPNLTGRVLIKDIELDESLGFTINSGCTHIHLQNVNNGSTEAILHLQGHFHCEISGGTGVYGNIFLESFHGVTDFMGLTGVKLIYCQDIRHCIIISADGCKFIDNCFVISSAPTFTDCQFVCGLQFLDGSEGVAEFNNCSHLSNIECYGTYDECLYVDAETCRGFVPAEDYGKVRTLSDDGTYESKVLPQIITASVDDTFHLTVKLYDGIKEVEISSATIDLPLEEMIVGASVSDDGKALILTLKNGETIEISVSDLVRGLAKNITDGSGTGAVQQVADGVANGIDFTGKNANAEALDSTLTGVLPYGATGDYSESFGGKSIASGKRAHSEGTTTIAKGKYSHAEGDSSVALGDMSHAEGCRTVAAHSGAHSEGFETVAGAPYTHAEGVRNRAELDGAHAEGEDNRVDGKAAHAEGKGNIVEGDYSHAEGSYNIVRGVSSHAEGQNNSIEADYAHVEGTDNTIGHEGVHISGKGNVSARDNQFIVGQFNAYDDKALFIVGNGSDKGNPSNALAVYEDGTIKGNLVPAKNGVTEYDQVYGKTASGAQYMFDVMYPRYTGNIKNRYGLVLMDSGQILCGTPTADNHGANKAYVDTTAAQVVTAAVDGLRTHVYTVTADKPCVILPGQSVIIFTGGNLTLTFNYVGGGTNVYEVGDNIALAGLDIDSAWGYAIRFAGLSTGAQTKENVGSITVETDGTNLMFTH